MTVDKADEEKRSKASRSKKGKTRENKAEAAEARRTSNSQQKSTARGPSMNTKGSLKT